MGLLTNWLEEKIDLSRIENADTIIGSIQDRLSTRLLAFHIATSYVADTLAKCEIKHFVKGEEVKDDFYYLFNISPNINQNASELKNKFIFELFYDGEALIFENKGSLYVADSFNIEERPMNQKGNLFQNITIKNEKKVFTKNASDVFYLKLDDKKLRTLVDGILSDYSELLKHSFDIYKSSNSEKYKLIMEEVRSGDKEFKERFETVIKKQLEAFINNRKSVYPQFKGYDLQKMSESSGETDSNDIREIRKEIFEITAEAFKMPVSMLYGNMTNTKDIVASYITFRIDPLAKMLSEEITRKTGSKQDYVNGTYFDVDTTSIMHQDVFEIADKVDKMISSGIYCIDEIRNKLGENPLGTEFSKQHWITKNYSKIEDVSNSETGNQIGVVSNNILKGGEVDE